jgi:hypothetical protein
LLGERLARHYGTRAAHLDAYVTYQKLPRAQWWSCAITSKSSGTNINKSCAVKRYWSHPWVRSLSRGGPGGHCRYPADRVPMCTRFKRSAPQLQIHSRCQEALALRHAPRHRARHPPKEGSSVATCPMAQSTLPIRKGLRCRHMPRGTVRATCQGRAPVLPRAPRHRTRHLTGEGSGVATCLMALGPPPAQGGSGVAAWPRHQDHRSAGLRYRHVSCGSRPASWCGRALEPPRAQ